MNEDTVKFVKKAFEDEVTTGIEVIKMGKLWGVFQDGQLVGNRAYHTEAEAKAIAEKMTEKKND